MDAQRKSDPEQDSAQAATHIAGAQQILKTLEEKIGKKHPEIEEAITKLEMALNVLAIKTGGML
jgi:hypothetical protein